MSPFPSTAAKIVAAAELAAWRTGQEGPVVFTNGVFDLLHRGHVDYLESARALGAVLIVAVNSDESVKSLGKGDDRPLTPADDRARLVAGLAAVDRVVIFHDPTPLSLIETLRPDVLVKGADYTRDAVVGADLVESRGGRVVLVPLTPFQSTTSLLEKIRGTR